MRHTTNVAVTAATVLAGALLAVPARAQQSVKTEIPVTPAKLAKIEEATARAAATRRVPNRRIQAVEREHGHLLYSYDVLVPGKTDIAEVNVDALTGKVLNVHTEPAADESNGAGSEKKSGS